ncbi:PqiB family protein [Kozakia baliensis]|uniref:Paraquat-inducible protein B n=1 Tax=Kozakia baliensis TaxID=153496 RepID=A0A1D8UVI8_9PROT|nr:MlaD family protein [Kozakia baliensis]AOX17638.1 paraquat-inducible protein B [Kozakia baliensis]GBR31297.1 paraquat-inducible protein B [Kozakia baliensis NRIC 0488]GEL62873.1 mammalian cell entry protein [Kozakia baliensis]
MSDHNDYSSNRFDEPAEAGTRRTRFSIIWLIPVIAVAIAGWLAWRSYIDRGPEITVTFDTASGLTAGQTQVKNKAVTLGTVQDIDLTPDMRRVIVHIRMNADASNILTDRTRFWVVRPRINGASITGLETLLSGAYIAIDPGESGGRYQTSFTGLETAPGVRSDQPGSTFMLVTPTLGSIGEGAPVFFRDVSVGEVLGHTMPPGGEGPILVQVFVKSPYDHYLRTDTRFWNVSGVQVGFGAGGLKVQLTSLQALFSGGVAFGLPERRRAVDAPRAPANSVFRLYASQSDADNARYHQRQKIATYLDNSVKGLAPGAQVAMYGIPVGSVTGVKLDINQKEASARVRVDMEIEPERVFDEQHLQDLSKYDGLLAGLVAHGMRASVESASFLTGESMIGLQFVKNAKPVFLTYEDGIPIVPSQPGGFDGIMASAATTMDKVAAMPLTQIGEHLNDLLAHTDKRIDSPEVKQSLTALRDSLRHMSTLTQHADEGMKPLMKRLPEMSAALQGTLQNAQTVLASYGGDTDFHRDLEGMVVQLGEAARSIRFLTDYLNRHPSALITGRHS